MHKLAIFSITGFTYGDPVTKHAHKFKMLIFCKDHRDKIEVPDPLGVEDLDEKTKRSKAE